MTTEGGADTPEAAGWHEHRPPRWLPRAILFVGLGAAAFMVGRFLFFKLGDLLLILLVSLFLSFAIEPAVDSLEARGWRRGRATALVFAVLLVVGGVLLSVIVDLVVQQVRSLVDDAPGLIKDATENINRSFNTKITTDSIIDRLREYQGELATAAGDVGGRVLSVTSSVLAVVFQTFTVLLFTFYMVTDGPKLRATICSVLPPQRQRMVLHMWEVAIHKTGGYLYSRLLLATISAAFAWVAFEVIGVPSPLALALWMGVVSQFVPVIGTYIGGALPLLVALLDEPRNALWILLFMFVYQQFENYFLAPRITSATMAIHPAVAFGVAIAGANIIGPIGALLALPAAAIIQAFVSTYLERHEVVEHEMVEGQLGPESGASPRSGIDPAAESTE